MAITEPSGKGILFVTSCIARKDVLSEEKFLEWYDDDHIAEIVETSGIRSARRFVNVDRSVPKPYLAMYPMEDFAFIRSEEFKKIRVQSDILPPPGIIYDLADIDVRNDQLIQVYDPTNKGVGNASTIVTSELEMKSGTISDTEFDSWYREELIPNISKAKGYLRTTRFKLIFARSNAESRVLKGLAPPTDEPPPMPPVWLNMHEFEGAVDLKELYSLTDSPGHDRIVANASKNEVNVWKLAKEFGTRDWFHGVEM